MSKPTQEDVKPKIDQSYKKSEEDCKVESDDEDGKSSKHSVYTVKSEDSRNSLTSSEARWLNRNKSSSELKNNEATKRSRQNYTWERLTVQPVLKAPGTDDDKTNKTFLKIANFPTSWSFSQVRDFILKEYGPVDYIYMAADENLRFMGVIKLGFDSFDDCWKAWDKLNGKKIDDVKLFADTVVSDDEDHLDAEVSAKRPKKSQSENWNEGDIDIWQTDPKRLYGFRPTFLSSLGISPPIDRWVHVSNFRCDKSELKEVMELAGDVLTCSVDTRGAKFAKVMYSHPIEAVQAISMLNNQQFYGQSLKVVMSQCSVGTVFLPKGLSGVGPGLGVQGKPLRDIVQQYERFMKGKSSFVNTIAFRNPASDEPEIRIPSKLDVLQNSSNNHHSNTPSPRESSSGSRLSNQWPYSNCKSESGLDFTDSQSALGGTGYSGTYTGQSRPLTGPISGPSGPSAMRGPQISGASTSGPIPGPYVAHTVGPASMSNPHTNMYNGPRLSAPMGGPNPMCGPSPMAGPMNGPGQMGVRGPMTGPSVPMGGPGPMSGPSFGMSGPGPISGPSFPMSGPGPMPGASMPMGGPSVMTRPSGPVGGPGSMAGPIGPINGPGQMGGPSVPMGGPAPMSGPSGPMIRPMTGPGGPSGVMSGYNNPAGPNSCTVELSNLPLSTTFALLSEKMAQCGRVMSLQLTSPGCAVVQFAERSQAERCYQQYNKFCVLGNVVEVKFL